MSCAAFLTIILRFEAQDITEDSIFSANFYRNPDCSIEGILQQGITAEAQVYTLVFDMARLPEPATATLSLLALAALAARRRRG